MSYTVSRNMQYQNRPYCKSHLLWEP